MTHFSDGIELGDLHLASNPFLTTRNGRPILAPRGIFAGEQLLLPKWRKALAGVRRGTANAKLALIGDSTTRGQGSGTTTAQALNGYPVQLSGLLDGSNGLRAGWQNLFGTGNATLSSFDSRVTLTGSFTTSSVSCGGQLFRMATTATLAFVPTVNCDTFDVYSVNNGTGSFTINLDGGATLATVNTTTSGTIVKTTVSGTLAGHTLNCVWASGTPYILGVDCYNSAVKQASCWNFGWLASTSANWSRQVTLFDPGPAIRNYLVPDLSIIDLGINDWSTSVSPATYRANLQTLITDCLAAGDVVLKTPAPTQDSVVSLDTQKQYVYMVYDLARENNLLVIDGFQRFSSWEVANALGFYNDNKHPSASGYSDIAMAVANAIGRV